MADNEKITYIYCFLDTNILLEFQTFDEVEWPKILNAKQVCLVLAPIVIRELDKHKSDYNDKRRQKRSRMLLSKVTKLVEKTQSTQGLASVRSNVTLMILPREPFLGRMSEEWKSEGLDQNDPDDRLLASVLDFSREHSTDQVLLLSDDSGPRFKAISHQLVALAPPSALNPHIEPPSPEEIENRKLKQQIQELTERLPNLKLGFYENGQIVDEVICRSSTAWLWKTSEEYVQGEIAQKRENLAGIIAKADNSVQEEEVQEFIETYEKYLAKLERALKMQFIRDFTPCCRLELTLTNEGSAPAHGIGVHMTFPKGTSLVTINKLDDEVKIRAELPDEPSLPEWAKPPVPEWIKKMLPSPSLLSALSTSSMLLSRGTLNSSLYLPGNFSQRPYNIDSFPFDRNTLKKRTDELSHHERWLFNPMVAYLPPNTRKGFSVKYSVYSHESIKPIIGELKVYWEQDT